MEPPVIIVGLGQLGCVFAEAFLRSGRSVFPVRRSDDLLAVSSAARSLSSDLPLFLIATGEDDLGSVLNQVPDFLRSKVVLLQNELRLSTWAKSLIADPTVCVVWFEKKPGRPLSEVRPSVAFGPEATALRDALSRVGVQVQVLRPGDDAPSERAHHLILKNLYLLGLNFTGLDHPGASAGQLLREAPETLSAITGELLALERQLLEISSLSPAAPAPCLDQTRLQTELEEAIHTDPGHSATGRSAKRRLERTLALARGHGLHLEVLEALASRHLQ